MPKRVFLSGLFGALVLILSTFVIDGLLGFNARINLKQIPDERRVYEVLKANIVEPGRYVCNPALDAEGRFPYREPVFAIQYAGIGHEAAGTEAMLGLLLFIAAPLIGAWMLSVTSERFRSVFSNRVLFFTAIGLLLALLGDMKGYGIGGHSLTQALVLAARTLVIWTLVGLAAAWPLRQKAAAPGKGAP